MHDIVLQHYDVLRFESIAVIVVLSNMLFQELNNQFFLNSKHSVHVYAFGLTSTPKAELFCSCKRRNL